MAESMCWPAASLSTACQMGGLDTLASCRAQQAVQRWTYAGARNPGADLWADTDGGVSDALLGGGTGGSGVADARGGCARCLESAVDLFCSDSEDGEEGGAMPHDAVASGQDPRDDCHSHTTLMLQRIVQPYEEEALRETLLDLGLGGTFDLVYVPRNRKGTSNLGYAFVNFATGRDAQRFIDLIAGKPLGSATAGKPCRVAYSRLQGQAFLRAAAAGVDRARSRC